MATQPTADTARIRRVAAELFERADDASVDRAAQLIKTASEAENQAAQAAKFAAEEAKLKDDLSDSKQRRSSEERRAYITSLTPVIATLLSTAALFVTLVLQYSQYRSQSKQAKDTLDLQDRAAKDQRQSAARTLELQTDAAEDVRWNEAIRVFATDKRLSPAEALLPTFSRSPRYREASNVMAQKLLLSSNSEDGFASLFKAFYIPITWDNLTEVIQTIRSVNAVLDPLAAKGLNDAGKHDKKHQFSPSEQIVYTRLTDEVASIDSKLAPILASRRPKDYQLDLSSTRIVNCNLVGADLHGAILTNAGFFYVDIKGADFSETTQFASSSFDSTAWWEARLMSPELINYLLNEPHSKFDANKNYGTTQTKVTQADYDKKIRRLYVASSSILARH